MTTNPTETADQAAARQARGEYQPGDQANGYTLTHDGTWTPTPAPQRWISRHSHAFAFGIAGAFVAVTALIATVTGGGPVTVHDEAVSIAETCYDDQPSSNGTKLPGSGTFDTCVGLVASTKADMYRASGTEIVDSDGDPVSYSYFPTAVSRDMSTWLTLDWKP